MDADRPTVISLVAAIERKKKRHYDSEAGISTIGVSSTDIPIGTLDERWH